MSRHIEIAGDMMNPSEKYSTN